MYKRICKPLQSNSFFLFGARGTGKTTLLQQIFDGPRVMRIDLLDPSEESAFALHPNLLRERIKACKVVPTHVVIDEVQKVPALLYQSQLVRRW